MMTGSTYTAIGEFQGNAEWSILVRVNGFSSQEDAECYAKNFRILLLDGKLFRDHADGYSPDDKPWIEVRDSDVSLSRLTSTARDKIARAHMASQADGMHMASTAVQSLKNYDRTGSDPLVITEADYEVVELPIKHWHQEMGLTCGFGSMSYAVESPKDYVSIPYGHAQQKNPLPAECYAALAALKAQAKAVIASIATDSPESGSTPTLSPLDAAQQSMAANEPWTSRVFRALLANSDGVTIDTADDAWLERVFGGYDENGSVHQTEQGLVEKCNRLEQLDVTRPIVVMAYHNNHNKVFSTTKPVDGLHVPYKIAGHDVRAFLAWAGSVNWRYQFERDLQCLAEDGEGNPLLTTSMPLSVFRDDFCRQGLTQQDSAIQTVMQRLLEATEGWEALGANEVDISGYQLDPD